MRTLIMLVLLSIFELNLLAQNSINPDAKVGKATIIHSDEVSEAFKKSYGLAVADSVLRVVSIGGKYNIGISVVTRSKINGKTPPDAIVHDVVAEVYHIIEGRGVLLIGGTLDSAMRIPADNPTVLKITGPSSRGTRIVGGTPYEVGPGDLVIIPPNTPHGFTEIKTNHIVYTLVRVDSDKVLEIKN